MGALAKEFFYSVDYCCGWVDYGQCNDLMSGNFKAELGNINDFTCDLWSGNA